MKRYTLVRTLALVAAAISLPSHGFYNPETGRWLNRDPLPEYAVAGMNQPALGETVRSLFMRDRQVFIHAEMRAYSYLRNHPLDAVEYLGLADLKNNSGLPVLAVGNVPLSARCISYIKSKHGTDLSEGINGVVFQVANGYDTGWGGVFSDVDGYWSAFAPGTGGTAIKIRFDATLDPSTFGKPRWTDTDVGSISAGFLGGASISDWINTTLDKTYRSFISAGVKASCCAANDLAHLDFAVHVGKSAISAFPDAK